MHQFALVLSFSVLMAFVSAMNILSTADFMTTYVNTGVTYRQSFVGIAFNYSQIVASSLNSTLFQGYFSNSKVYGLAAAGWNINLKFPLGYKFNCGSYSAFADCNSTCTASLSSSMTRINAFLRNTGSPSAGTVTVGYDYQCANFENVAYLNYFMNVALNYLASFGSNNYYIPIEIVDQADRFATLGINSNYSASQFIIDMTALTTYFTSQGFTYPFLGPGVTEDADPSWLKAFDSVSSLPFFAYTVRCVVFKNVTSLTMAQVLDESNYATYLNNRFTYPGGFINPNNGRVQITTITMTDGSGIAGVTNAFVSAIWAIDTALQFSIFGGKAIKFPVDFDNPYLSVLGGNSTFYPPNAIYYGLLVLQQLAYVKPQIILPSVVNGTSSSIKVYGFTIPNQFITLIINKDSNPSASGVVNLLIYSNDQLECLYLTAPTLSETTNIKWAGYNFVGNSSTPQGSYSSIFYQSNNNSYQVQVNYSQVVLCYAGNPYQSFPDYYKFEAFVSFLIVMIISLMI